MQALFDRISARPLSALLSPSAEVSVGNGSEFPGIFCQPFVKVLSCSFHSLSDLCQERRNVLFKHRAPVFAEALVSLTIASVYMEHKSRIGSLVDDLYASLEADGSNLVGSAGRRAAGNMNLRKCAVLKAVLSHLLHQCAD